MLKRLACRFVILVALGAGLSPVAGVALPLPDNAAQWTLVLRHDQVGRTDFIPGPAAAHPQAYAEHCCKICSKGKACGDTCIARDKVCHVGPGCACDE